jgi:diacylglycerol O-acyltransferase / wax synthase
MPRPSIVDSGWLLIEERERPMHVGGLMLFRTPGDAPPGYLHDLAQEMREPREVRPPFNWRLARPSASPGLNAWVEDEVDLEYHFRHLSLPEPGRIRELLALVSQLHANLLDRHRPLWECYLVEGIEDGRFAMYTKVHHSLMDGVAAIRQVLKAFSADPDDRTQVAPWGVPSRAGEDTGAEYEGEEEEGAEAEGAASGANPLTWAWRTMSGLAGGVTSTVGLARAVAEQLARAPFDQTITAPFEAPPSMLNVKLTGARRFVAQSYDFERVRSVSRALDVTINDVMLAMCSSALRHYLIDQQALPHRPLVALVPVSFRGESGDSGNAISLVPANLATHVSDPEARLELIRDSMNRVKDRLRGLNSMQMIEYGLLMTAPVILGNLTGLSGKLRWPSYNLVISNVPGPEQRLHWNGAPMEGMYPLSLLTEGYAINITQTSYAGSMEFGITADRRALPSIQRIIDHLETGLEELEDVAGLYQPVRS